MTQRNDHTFIELLRGSRKSAAGTISVLSYLKHIIMFDTEIWVFQHPSTWSIHCCSIRWNGSCKIKYRHQSLAPRLHTMADLDVQMWRGGGGGIPPPARPWEKRGTQSQENIFLAFQASVWLKIRRWGRGRGRVPLAPPRDPSLTHEIRYQMQDKSARLCTIMSP